MGEEAGLAAEESTQQAVVQRAPNFLKFYANNVVAEATAWDVRLTFGQFDNVEGHIINTQQLSVTMSFGLAKLMLFWVEAQILAHEIETGKRVGLRESVLPPLPDLSPEEQQNPNNVKLREAVKKLRERLIAGLD
jgi:hypothetical protein